MPVCIAGMHRSGTSMVTKILHTAGLELGPESDLIPSNPNNPEGFWENRRFLRINNGLLKELRSAWDCPPPAPPDWSEGRFDPYRTQASELLEKFAGREPWGWKDPRTCLTLPFWQSIAGPLRMVIVVRNPLEVALSLRKRNGFSYALGLALWHAYNLRLWEATAASDRIVTHYDAYSREPRVELRRLLGFLGQSVDQANFEELLAVHVAELRHHEVTAQNLSAAEVAPDILDLYSTLCDEANWQDSAQGPANGEASSPALTTLLDESEPPLLTARPDRRPMKNERPKLRQRLDEAEARIAELEQTVEAQRIALAQYEAEVQGTIPDRRRLSS